MTLTLTTTEQLARARADLRMGVPVVVAGLGIVMAVETARARDLAGKSDLLCRRNSTTGAVECLTNRSAVELNEELHAHN